MLFFRSQKLWGKSSKELRIVGLEKALLVLQFYANLRVTPLGFYLRGIVNKTNLNLDKTTSSFVSFILIKIY